MILGDGLLLLFGVCLFFECGGGLWSTKIRWYNVQLCFPTELSMASFLSSFLSLPETVPNKAFTEHHQNHSVAVQRLLGKVSVIITAFQRLTSPPVDHGPTQHVGLR